MNERAWTLVDGYLQRSAELRVSAHTLGNGARVVDAGIGVPGGLAAGRALAELCMGGLGSLEFTNVTIGRDSWPAGASVDRPSGGSLHGLAVRCAGRRTGLCRRADGAA